MSLRPRVTIAAVGKLREAFFRDAVAEYAKRLTGMTTRFEIVEVAEEPIPDPAGAALETRVCQKEGERLLGKIGPRATAIVCDGAGESLSSPAFARRLARLSGEEGAGDFVFVVGGPLGLSDDVRSRADLLLSFGPMTLPHPLARIVLLEQIYRALQIQRGSAYHR